ncbi:PhnD/SsuA/transferrin family substrate-binding protein [Heliorestis acidaminivorans]|uniref:PhnD/SsuA/transferrin family substrate-binding protein n=1 Tax=Heliorestis acidaminivorans TaxID=553427 RepID=A0A6I0F7U0_9FIRM|nr:PhnD/SsuA/transferrin family substrate-binding protein [Heliorestis acidaminivorans]KAB2953463.1 PhnD/SsuA/transferrin family substrate-binding protein [Heliorestis acidaminivorans]
MKKLLLVVAAMFLSLSILTGCSSEASKKDSGPIVMVWYPNESGEDLKSARDEYSRIIEEATGRKVEHRLTTDYVIAIETIANGNAHIAYMGAQGYIEANKKNNKVLPLFVNSGSSGTLDDAVYYSWLAVKKGNEDQYRNGSAFSIDNIEGKRFSFVSNNSTSGFRVPSAGIVNHFSQKDKWKNLQAEDLLEGGRNKLLSEVLYGGSHQGTTVNLLTDKADIASFCDTCVANYIEHASGTPNRPGAVYRIRQDADAPFTNLKGEEFVLISVTPVLNPPFVTNTDVLDEETQKALIAAFTSDEVKNNERIFVPKDSSFKGLFQKSSGNERFLDVKDEWFNPVRELSN